MCDPQRERVRRIKVARMGCWIVSGVLPMITSGFLDNRVSMSDRQLVESTVKFECQGPRARHNTYYSPRSSHLSRSSRSTPLIRAYQTHLDRFDPLNLTLKDSVHRVYSIQLGFQRVILAKPDFPLGVVPIIDPRL